MATGKTKRTRRDGGAEERRKNCHPLGSRIKPREPQINGGMHQFPMQKRPGGGGGYFLPNGAGNWAIDRVRSWLGPCLPMLSASLQLICVHVWRIISKRMDSLPKLEGR